MTREEVYKELEQVDAYFRSSFDAMYGTVVCEKFRSWVDAIEHALALLKEQEPVEPIPTEDDDWICGACNNSVVGTEELDEGGFTPIRFNYCPNCGRAVKWDG